MEWELNISQIATSSFEDNFEIVSLLSGISNAVKYHNLTKKILRGGEQIKFFLARAKLS